MRCTKRIRITKKRGELKAHLFFVVPEPSLVQEGSLSVPLDIPLTFRTFFLIG
jgi:hypothetical protein